MGTPFQDFLFSRVLQNEDPVVQAEEGTSGYWGKPVPSFDPRLIDEQTGGVRDDIRLQVLNELYNFWSGLYNEPEQWSTAWVAGSALSHQYSEHNQPDLDVLVGVDYTTFYEHNPQYRGLSEAALAARFNDEFHRLLWPQTENFLGTFELTFYVNPGASDIRAINPYAAYNLNANEWTVQPVEVPEDWDPRTYFPNEWWRTLDTDVASATALVGQYRRVSDAVRRLPTGDPVQLSHLAELRRIGQRAADMFEDIHGGRRRAFNDMGQGFFDYNNLRWQVHKRAGTVKALNTIAAVHKDARRFQQGELYGEELAGAQEALTKAQVHAALGSTAWYRKKMFGR
jgi:hypothetical protein